MTLFSETPSKDAVAGGEVDTSVRVVINGVLGRMGNTVLSSLPAKFDDESDKKILPVGGVARSAGSSAWVRGGVPLASSLEEILENESDLEEVVVVDFTGRQGFLDVVEKASRLGVSVVSGSTGLSSEDYAKVERLARRNSISVFHASSFALGAVVLEWLVKKASPYFKYADIVESHHEMKEDAPSGTAISIAKAMASSREEDFISPYTKHSTMEHARGAQYKGISIHSSRMPGRMCRHEVVFGASSQTLSLIHETLDRDAFAPGIIEAIRYVVNAPVGLTVGLEKILGLNDAGK